LEETWSSSVTYTYPDEFTDDDNVGTNSIAPYVKITRKVKGLYISNIHGNGWKIVMP
jgi:hypothetical protein